MVPSVHYFYVKTKMLVGFKICISVPLSISADGNTLYAFGYNLEEIRSESHIDFCKQ